LGTRERIIVLQYSPFSRWTFFCYFSKRIKFCF